MSNVLNILTDDILKDRKKILYCVFLLLIVGLGIYLRIWWINNIPTEQKFDFATYQVLAENIYNGKGHVLDGLPIAWQGSGYSYLLAFFYKIMGNTNELTGKYLNVILSSLTLMFSYFIYHKFFKNKFYACLCFIITAIFPNLIAYNNVLGTETMFLFLIACILLVQTYITNRKTTYPLLGILCGLSALTKPFMLVYPFILAVIDWVEYKNIKSSFIYFGVVMVSCVVVISPWASRNYRLFNRIIPVSYNSGYVLYINNNDTNVTGSWLDLNDVETTEDVKIQIEAYLENGEKSIKASSDIEPLLKSEASQWIRKNPMEFLKLGFLRLKSTYFSGANDIEQWAMNGFTKEHVSGYWDEVQYLRNKNALQATFDMNIYIFSAGSFIFFLALFKKYFFSCFFNNLNKKSVKNKLDYSSNIIFLNIAFFILISFVFEGQARYVFQTIIFMIAAFGKLIEGLNRTVY